MKTELLNRLEVWANDTHAGVTGAWKTEQAIAGKLCRVTWKRADEAWKSCLTKTPVYNFDGCLTSGETVITFRFQAQRNESKQRGQSAAFRAMVQWFLSRQPVATP